MGKSRLRSVLILSRLSASLVQRGPCRGKPNFRKTNLITWKDLFGVHFFPFGSARVHSPNRHSRCRPNEESQPWRQPPRSGLADSLSPVTGDAARIYIRKAGGGFVLWDPHHTKPQLASLWAGPETHFLKKGTQHFYVFQWGRVGSNVIPRTAPSKRGMKKLSFQIKLNPSLSSYRISLRISWGPELYFLVMPNGILSTLSRRHIPDLFRSLTATLGREFSVYR